LQINGQGEFMIPETGGTLILRKVRIDAFPSGTRVGQDKREALVDWEKICWPVRVSSLKAGDRFQPLGLRGTKKVARFLMDRKIPRFRRAQIPLLWSRDQLVWVAGVEIAQPFALGPDSVAALHLEYRTGGKRN
jgi:tRNA(Ile)-lysidine synthase